MSICSVPGCPEEAVEQGRCRPHRKEAVGTGSRGSTSASRSRRRRILDAAKDNQGTPLCFYCKWAEATIADHFHPVTLGGSDAEGNLVAACQPCNSRKGKRLPGEFLKSHWLAERRRR